MSNEQLTKLTDRNVRILYLSPMNIAVYRSKGDASQGAGLPGIQAINEFTKNNSFLLRYPETRRFGLYPNKQDENGDWGFELWITVQNDTDIPEPFVKSKFNGGLYAAHTIPVGFYSEWTLLKEWVKDKGHYIFDDKCRVVPEITNQEWVLEEILNYRGESPDNYITPMQVDLLLPIKENLLG